MSRVEKLTFVIDVCDKKLAREDLAGHCFIASCKIALYLQLIEITKRIEANYLEGPFRRLLKAQAVYFEWRGWAEIELAPTAYIHSIRSFFQSLVAGRPLGDWQTAVINDDH